MQKHLFFGFVTFFTISANAGFGIWSSAVLLKVNGSSQYYNNTAPGGGNNFGTSNFQGTNLGTFVGNAGQLQIGGGGLKTYKNGGGNVCGGTIYYVVYPTGSRPASPVFTSVNIAYGCDCSSSQLSCTGNSSCGPGDQVWQNGAPAYTDITTGLPIGNYTLELYYSISGDPTSSLCGSTAYDNNSGNASNYTASFSITSVLPLQLVSFNAKEVNKAVQLNWTVSDNQEAVSFVIERSSDGNLFEALGAVDASNLQGDVNYSYVDPKPESNVSELYRLKLIDRNGSVKYSENKAVKFSEQTIAIKLQTNPVHDALKLILQNDKATVLSTSIINDKGQLLSKKQCSVDAGNITVNISVSQLPAGVYRLIVEEGTTIKTLSFVKN